MKTILIPHDFSRYADNALEFALGIAKKQQYNIVLLHVCPLPYEFAVRIEEAVNSIDHYAKKQLNSLIENIKKNNQYSGIECRGETLVGSTVSSIISFADQNNINLIVMGTKGASGLSKLFLGSNSAEISRRTNVPVLMIPEKADIQQVQEIYYALDYRNTTLKSIENVIAKVSDLGMPLHTAHVAREENLYEEILHNNLKSLLNEHFPSSFLSHQLIFNASPAQGIKTLMKDNPAAVFVITSHLKSFYDSLFLDSVSQELAYQSTAPVIVINEPDEER